MTEPRILTQLRDVLDAVPSAFTDLDGHRNASVLVAIRRLATPRLVLTARPMAMAHHPGQVSFPGGKQDGVETPIDCALREADEELGITRDQVELLGALPPRRSGQGFWVTPIVGAIPYELVLRPDPHEVERVFEVCFDELRDHERWYEQVGAPGRPVSPHFDLDGAVLWGLTARLVWDLFERLDRPDGSAWSD